MQYRESVIEKLEYENKELQDQIQGKDSKSSQKIDDLSSFNQNEQRKYEEIQNTLNKRIHELERAL